MISSNVFGEQRFFYNNEVSNVCLIDANVNSRNTPARSDRPASHKRLRQQRKKGEEWS
jgi:hypothetical protein